ncbi:TauD/TfdA family dioxygenase [Micromonospora sp. BRA006-A]|nr:TauD/TfdA family dioxygenase [Micromonospora sp. BRA006-A]
MTTSIAAEVRLVPGALGAEVHGVDLNTLTDEGFALIHDLLLKHQVVFLAGQTGPMPQAHVAFGRRFGEVELHRTCPGWTGTRGSSSSTPPTAARSTSGTPT